MMRPTKELAGCAPAFRHSNVRRTYSKRPTVRPLRGRCGAVRSSDANKRQHNAHSTQHTAHSTALTNTLQTGRQRLRQRRRYAPCRNIPNTKHQTPHVCACACVCVRRFHAHDDHHYSILLTLIYGAIHTYMHTHTSTWTLFGWRMLTLCCACVVVCGCTGCSATADSNGGGWHEIASTCVCTELRMLLV